MLEFRILGPLAAVEDGRPIGLGGPRQRSLLAILLLHRGEAVSSDRLIEELWNGAPPPSAPKTLQAYVSHLRKALGAGVVVTRGGGYLVDVAPEQLDAARFAALVEQARAASSSAAARELLGQALGLWHGDVLADLAYEPFAQAPVARLEEQRLDALEDRIDADLALGRHRAAAGELDALVAAHPGRERLLAQQMLSLYRGGRHTEALEVYRRERHELQERMGLEPGPELRALEQQILQHDPQLHPVAARRTRRRRGLFAAGLATALAAVIAVAVAPRGHAAPVRLQANTVVAIDVRTNGVVAAVPVGARPGAIAAAAGSLWVANLDDRTVARVDERTARTLSELPVGDPPTGIAAAGGRVWVARGGATAASVAVAPIDPQFDVLGRSVRVAEVVAGAAGLLAANGSALYVAPAYGQLATLDASGRITRQLDPNTAPTAIAAADGTVWLTDGDADNVTRVDATGAVSSLPVGDNPAGIAAGEGAIWVAESGDDRVARIDPDTLAVTRTIAVGDAPAGVATGAGSIWVANSGDGTVTRIDPRSGRRIATIAVGGSPQSIVVAGGRAWVTDDARTIAPRGGDGALRIDSHEPVSSMDPAVADDPRADLLLYETCAKLLNYPDRAGAAGDELVPEVAQALPAVSRDGRTYRYTIRPGFRFSPPSGAPVTAATFKSTIERTLSPRMHSPLASELGDIAGARAFMAGRTAHISGVSAAGDVLTIRLTAPAGDLPTRLAQSAFCAVPANTPRTPDTVRTIPMAGPYRIASVTPRQGVVLTRNPNYHGNRPRNPARIEFAIGMSSRTAVAQVEHGTADVTSSVPASEDAHLTARYGGKQYFTELAPQLDFFALNTQRPLFADVRTRLAVNYAIDRAALDRLGDEYVRLPEHETDHYIPPGTPGYHDSQFFPTVPELAEARALASPRASNTLIFDACDIAPCSQQAQVVKTDLARIGLRVEVKTMPDEVIAAKLATPGTHWDMAWQGWLPDYRDPSAMLNFLLSGGTLLPRLADPVFQARLAAADRLSGTRRYLAYLQLDADLTREAAPLVAYGNLHSRVFVSARVGCTVEGVYGMDLGALCLR